MKGSLAVALLLGIALGGCSGADPDPLDAPSAETPAGAGDDAGPSAAGNQSMEAPQWQVGQAWRWRLQSRTAPEAYEAQTVVLSVDGATYGIGSSDALAAADVYPFHLVGLGVVDAATLAWDAHHAPVQLVRFPLVDGDRFTNDFWSAPGAEVTVTAANVTGPDGPEPGFRSVARYAGAEAVFMEADYSPARGQFVRVATFFGGAEPFAEAVLVAESTDATGTPFVGTELARWSATAADPTTLTPRQLAVANGADLLILVCFITGDPGAYSATVAEPGAPPGEPAQAPACTSQGSPETSYHHLVVPAAPGPAAVSAMVAGQGTVTVEVFTVDTGE